MNFIILIALLIQPSLQAEIRNHLKYRKIFRGISGI